MDERTIRLIVVLALFALSFVRLLRKARSGNRPKPQTPPAVRLPTQATPAPTATPSPTDPAATAIANPWLDADRSSPLATFAALVVWLGGNAAVWLTLFELPALEDIPVNWRLAAGVMANLFLIWLARAARARLRARRGPQMPGGNPFPDS
jgi:hypothetical protein